MKDSTKLFSNRVENYVKYRPSYPVAVIDFLKAECGLTPNHVIADVGSGTGKLSELFLKNGNQVLGIEPNLEMRQGGEQFLKDYKRFESIDGTAEATTLAGHSVNIVTAGQAFHWFDPVKTRVEFTRILKPGGWVVLIWNNRQTDTTPFLREYEELIVKYSIDYREVNHKNMDVARIGAFFGAGGFKQIKFSNTQAFGFEGLKGRLLSSSYAPEAGHPNHIPMTKALHELFQKHAADGSVNLDCDTLVFFGQL